MLETVINRFRAAAENQEGPTDRQYGMRKARRAIYVIKLVTGLTEYYLRKRQCQQILHDDDFGCEERIYSCQLESYTQNFRNYWYSQDVDARITSYLQEQKFWCDDDDRLKEYVATQDLYCAHCFGISCKDVFNLPIPEETTVADNADDIVPFMIAKHLENAELGQYKSISAVKVKVKYTGLTGRKNYVRIRARNHIITYKPAIKYVHGGYITEKDNA